MDEVMKWATGPAFQNRYAGGVKNLIAFTSGHVIQGWYMTTSGGSIVLSSRESWERTFGAAPQKRPLN